MKKLICAIVIMSLLSGGCDSGDALIGVAGAAAGFGIAKWQEQRQTYSEPKNEYGYKSNNEYQYKSHESDLDRLKKENAYLKQKIGKETKKKTVYM